jgi:uncharacterized protein (TIGR00297 family)
LNQSYIMRALHTTNLLLSLLCVTLTVTSTHSVAYAFVVTPTIHQRTRHRRTAAIIAPADVLQALPSFSRVNQSLQLTARTTTQTVTRPITTTTSTQLHLAALPHNISTITSSLFTSTGQVPLLQSLALNVILFTLLSPKLLTMLTPAGFVHAMVLGTGLWTTLGWKGWTYCVLYLGFGQAVTKIRFAEKEQRGLAEGRGGRRGPENVWGSALVGLICAACSVQGPTLFGIRSDVYVLAYVASIATKLADTFASEIGKAFGKTTFLITNLQRVEPGTEGAVSAEGTAAAIVGGALLSLYAYAVGLIASPSAVVVSTVAAFVATNAESVLGATLQGKPGLEWMTNEVVNGLNTLIGASLAAACGVFLLGMKA